MADEDFSPSDGLSDIWIEFDGIDRELESTDAFVRFRFVRSRGGHHQVLSTISLPAPASPDGLRGQVAQAHREMIRILRQGIWTLDKVGRSYSQTRPE